MSPYVTIRGPLITEKTEGARALEQTLAFRVHPKATKTDIKNAVQAIFKVKVEGVRTANYLGKRKRWGKSEGLRTSWKKAFVKLKEGEKMVEYAQI